MKKKWFVWGMAALVTLAMVPESTVSAKNLTSQSDLAESEQDSQNEVEDNQQEEVQENPNEQENDNQDTPEKSSDIIVTKKKTLKGNVTYLADPGLGSGSWTTSDKKVVKISQKKGSTCVLTAVTPGKAEVTYKNKEQSVKYKITVKKVTKTVKKNLKSCELLQLDPEQGKGTWETNNRNIASIVKKKDTKKYVKAKKAGTATVTFQNELATYKYKIKVTAAKTLPVNTAYLTMNSIGGVEPFFLVSNNSDKRIKYLDFNAYFYTKSGKPAKYEGKNYAKLRVVGPIKAWDTGFFHWDPVIYNKTAGRMRIKRVIITYTDGSKKIVKINKTYR